ncbi:lysosomal alpha-glucosidase [Eucyclogobius newberryi]|uniref:lysosomal alpha-glucosidase n=1 Tax=Eucyclogobius newberryi TaxID=166745 RepID=UPI003B5CDF64
MVWSLWSHRSMVSYKRLDPEQVRFSGGAFSDERAPVYEETAVPEPEETPLMRWTPRCSVTRSLLVIGCLLLLLLGGWLLGTQYWLLSSSSSSTIPHPPPAPGKPSKSNSTAPPREACTVIPEAWRFDCYPERGVVVTQDLCEGRNCCFVPQGQNGVPWCFYPTDFPSYSLVSVQPTPLGQKATLERQKKTYYPGDIMSLQLEVFEETNTRLHVKITDPSSPRFEVPIAVPSATERAQSPEYVLELSKEPFGVIVRRRSTGTVLLNTTMAPLFYADQFLQVSSSLPSASIYGLGEHRSSFRHDVQWNTLTMWARDVPPTEKTNLYGVHPFYLGLEEAGLAHGFFLLNSNAMDVVLQPAPAITWRTIGGILDFYLFLGPEPASVVQQYLEVVGRPAMPIYWALGFHLCRWGYQTSNATWDVVKSMRSYGIPQDVQWNDIDYMDRFLDFTYDPVNFNTLPDLVKDLHEHDQRYVLILDPGISSTQPPGAYWPYDEGLKRGLFIKDADGNALIGKVWPGLTAYPDFSDEATHQWWFENLQRFYRRVPFDGLWIDMNEPSNFLDGSTNGCPSNAIENPPYTPGVLGGLLRSKTVCASSQQKLSSHYNLHSLYGLQEAKATSSALTRLLGKRPFVISRSSFPSQGQYSGHWLGDNRSQWKDMAASIAGILSFNVLGVPLVGADVCGFSEQTDEELCVRWTQLGALYPFSRNHNALDSKAQDPSAFSPSARAAMRSALLLRYSLFPLLYTLFHQAHAHGHTVARPLMFEFPHDSRTYGIDRQFLWGRGLLVTPVLLPGVDSVEGYFPAGRWYDYYTGDGFLSAGESMSLPAPLDKINVHLREGTIIPTQRPNVTLWVSRGQPLHLLSALSEDGDASGDLFWDDGESLHTYEEQQYAYVLFRVHKNVLSSEVVRGHLEASYITVESASFYGVQPRPEQVLVNGLEAGFSYEDNKVLTVTDLGLNLNQSFTVSWS